MVKRREFLLGSLAVGAGSVSYILRDARRAVPSRGETASGSPGGEQSRFFDDDDGVTTYQITHRRALEGRVAPAAPGARVRLRDPDGTIVATARAGPAGRFRFPDVGCGTYCRWGAGFFVPITYSVDLWDARFAPATVTEVEPSDEPVVPVSAGGTITARVIDADGQPIPHTKVQLRYRTDGAHRPQTKEAGTNRLGLACLDRVAIGTVVVLAAQRAPTARRKISVPSRAETRTEELFNETVVIRL